MDTIKISISKEFSKTPGPRKKTEGNFSAELFLDKIFESKFKDALEKNITIEIDLDGTLGYGTSFLEEVFGGLARKYGTAAVKNTLKIISIEEPWLIDDINSYIDDVSKNSK